MGEKRKKRVNGKIKMIEKRGEGLFLGLGWVGLGV
jgi:hypothetical protein